MKKRKIKENNIQVRRYDDDFIEQCAEQYLEKKKDKSKYTPLSFEYYLEMEDIMNQYLCYYNRKYLERNIDIN